MSGEHRHGAQILSIIRPGPIHLLLPPSLPSFLPSSPHSFTHSFIPFPCVKQLLPVRHHPEGSRNSSCQAPTAEMRAARKEDGEGTSDPERQRCAQFSGECCGIAFLFPLLLLESSIRFAIHPNAYSRCFEAESPASADLAASSHVQVPSSLRDSPAGKMSCCSLSRDLAPGPDLPC